jgi:transposase
MRQKSSTTNSPSERLVTTIRRATRKQYSAEEKIRIVLDGLRASPALPSCAVERHGAQGDLGRNKTSIAINLVSRPRESGV